MRLLFDQRGPGSIDDHRANSAEVEAAQEWSGSQLAWPAQIDEQLDKHLPELSELTRKLSHGGTLGHVKFALKKGKALVRQGITEFIEGGGNASRFLPRRRLHRRKRPWEMSRPAPELLPRCSDCGRNPGRTEGGRRA